MYETNQGVADSEYISLMESNLKQEILQSNSVGTFLSLIQVHCSSMVVFIEALGTRWIKISCSSDLIWVLVVNAWFLLSRITFILNVVNFITDCMAYHGTISFIYITVDVVIILQLALLIYSVYLINQKLQQNVKTLSAYINLVTICNESFPLAVLYVILAIGSDLFSAYLWYNYNGQLQNKMYFATEVFTMTTTTAFLTSTLLFVIIDTKTVFALTNNITMQFSNKSLSVTSYNKVRHQIDKIVNSSKGINSLRIGVAMLYVLVVIICLFNSEFFTMLSVIAAMKEIVFISIIFFEVARVNEHADKLTKLLGKCTLHFDPRDSMPNNPTTTAINNETALLQHRSSASSATSVPNTTAMAIDMEFDNSGVYFDPDVHVKMMIFNDLICDPISFTLAGKRVTKLDTALHLIAVSVAILVGIIRSLVLSGIK